MPNDNTHLDTHTFFNTLNKYFSEKINVNGQNIGIDVGSLASFISRVKNQLQLVFLNQTLENAEREELSVYLAWLFNELIFISINSVEDLSKKNIELQNAILSNAYKKERWWFFKLISAYTSFLKQTTSWHLPKGSEPVPPFVPSEEALGKIQESLKTKLVFHKILIQNEEQLNQLIYTCISQLIYAAPLYCNMKKDQEIEARDTVMEILRGKSLLNKALSVSFFSKYLKVMAEFTHDNTRFFISIMHTMTIIFKDIPSWIHQYEEDAKRLQITIELFFRETPVEHLDFSNGDSLRLLVTYASEILFHQIVNYNKPWFNKKIPELLTMMLIKVLDGIEFEPQAVESLRNLVELGDRSTDVNLLMKYLVIAEVEATNVFSQKLTEISQTWKVLHDRATKKIDDPSRLVTDELFHISDFLLLAVQIEFSITQRHQLRHGTLPRTCVCSSVTDLEESQESPLKRFNDLNKRISYVLIDNLEEITEKLLAALEQQNSFDGEMARCAIDIFSCIAKFSVQSSVLDTVKQSLIAIIASPFYKCLKDSPSFSKLGGFQQVMTLLPNKFKKFFESPNSEPYSNKFKCDSIVQLSQLEVSRVSNSCWWLIENIFQFVSKHGSIEMKNSLFNCFTNFVINNSDKFSYCVEIYQKLLSNMNDNPCVLVQPLRNILCLTGRNVIVLKLPTKENIFMHSIICNDCELSSTKFPKAQSSGNEVKRLMALMKDTKGSLVSPDVIKQQVKSLHLDVPTFFKQSNEFKIEMFRIIPAMLNHSQDFKSFVEQDKGKALFQGIFVKNEQVLEQLELHLKNIIRNVLKQDFSEKLKKEIFDSCFGQLAAIAKFTAYGTDAKMQLLTVNLTFIFATNVVNENDTVKCFKIFLLYIVQNNSQIMGQASLLALQMADWNGTSLEQLMSWHKTFIMRHVVRLVCTNFFNYNTSLTLSLANFAKRLNLPGLRQLVPSNLDTIISVILPTGIDSKPLMTSLDNLCTMVPLAQAIEENFMKIYLHIYTTETLEVREKCLKFIEVTTGTSIQGLLKRDKKKTVEEALIYYNKSQDFVIEVMSKVLGHQNSEQALSTDVLDEMAEDIKQRFLGVLIYFEPFLTSNSCERAIKKNILLSIGDIIRFLTAEHISGFCFKIITILKAAVEQTSVDLSEACISVWRILIRTCEVTSLAPILSTIIVSLEFFIDKYPNEVSSLYKYLIIDNQNLLSRNILDLFFIEKTRVDDNIKMIVLNMIDSQKPKEEENFKHNLQSLLRQMNSENSDLKIRVYCLQYLKELIQKNRVEVNELICGGMTMDPMIEELLHVLVNNCKNTSSEALQLATAECLGELGAIEPSLQRKNYASQQEFPKTIHSDAFAKMALAQLCRSYQYKNDPKYIDAHSLAIQQILKSRKVTTVNKDANHVWMAIPEKMRSLMEPLLTSSYFPTTNVPTTAHPIFWYNAQTAADWAYKWAACLIEKISDGETRNLLECIKPSMRHNQYTTSMFLPYILLHNLILSDPSTHHLIQEEIQAIFDIVVTEKDSFVQEKAEGRKPLFVKWFNFRPLETLNKNTPDSGIKAVAIRVAKLIFEIFDFLESYRRTHSCSVISNFLNSFDVEEMAHVNYNCGEYARAMIYLETKLKALKTDEGSANAFQKELSFLTNIYAKLGCPDSVEGVQALKTTEWSLEEKILISNVTGNFQDSAACFERLMQIGEAKIEHINTMMNTYISLDQPETALLIYENMIRKLDASQQSLCKNMKAEPLWRLSRFEELDELLADKTVQQSTDWGVCAGKLLSTFHKLSGVEGGNSADFSDELRNTRLAMVKNLKISGSEHTAYSKNYRGVINLHLISELEKAETAVEEIGKKESSHQYRMETLGNLIRDSNRRMEFIRKNSTFEESVLCFHRVILSVTRTVLDNLGHELYNNHELESLSWNELNEMIDVEMGKLWIKSTKLACNNKKYQQAQTYILNAEPYQPKNLFIEKAKLHWIKKDQVNAFKTLELGTKKILVDAGEHLSKEESEIYAEGKLMIACYNKEAINVDFETNKKLFFDAKVKGAESEKVYLLIAEYMDRFYCTEDDSQLGRIGQPHHMLELMKYYFRSMAFGSEYVFQSMPRLLSIWLDTTAKYNNSSRFQTEFAEINKTAEKLVEYLAPYYFYTAFSQLISRICHPSQEVFNILKTILVKLILAYPQQSLWFLVPMLKSSHTQREKRCKEILNDRRVVHLQQLIKEFNWLVDRFINLATVPMNEKSKTILLDSYVPDLNNLSNRPHQIILPFQCNLQLTRMCDQKTLKFADKLVYIHKIKPNIEVMKSLQRPRKVVLVGSDGREYVVLFKSKDDLRIDLRYCEFSNVLKEFLHKDPESRHRELTTRTYSVIPLNETAGLIEWVPNLRTLKDIITSEYVKKNYKLPSAGEIEQKKMEKLKKPNQVAEFRKLKEKYYPALNDYFRQQFATPQNYYKARSSFIKTTAVMSIVGYILGLGDRHGENILLDVLSGETFHVDFNMLFNRGEQLLVPETVPFRLTHNMIDAMGVLGIEGPFKKNCEIILRVLQKEKNTLMSYLRPLVYDTVLKNNEAWKRSKEGRQGDKERVEQDAVVSNKKIEMRLNGIVSKYKGSSEIPLSTEGQVNFIIGEATSEENLAAMFRGWMPWM